MERGAGRHAGPVQDPSLAAPRDESLEHACACGTVLRGMRRSFLPARRLAANLRDVAFPRNRDTGL